MYLAVSLLSAVVLFYRLLNLDLKNQQQAQMQILCHSAFGRSVPRHVKIITHRMSANTDYKLIMLGGTL